MDLLSYATPDDLLSGEWLEAVPDNARALIRRASLLVDHATRFDRFDTDADERPVDAKIAAAFRDATCQQVAEWVTAGIDPNAGPTGQTPQVESQTTEGHSVKYSNLATLQDIAAATEHLCRASVLILRRRGLASLVPGML